MALPYSDKFLHEPIEILHHALAMHGIESVEKDKVGSAGIPLFVLEHFLPHKEHGNSRRGEEDGIGHAAAATRVPGAAVVRIGAKGNSEVAADLHLVMVLDAGHGAPEIREIVGSESESSGEAIKTEHLPRPQHLRR